MVGCVAADDPGLPEAFHHGESIMKLESLVSERMARETAARQTAQEAAEARQVKFFQDERAAGTLQGAVMGNPSAAVRVLGPLEVIRIGCGSGKGAA